jgi:hypothetical protein
VADLVKSLSDVIPAHLHKEVEQELITGWRQKEVAMRHQTAQLGAFHKSHESKPVEGLGKLVAQIPADAFHYWGQRLGYECWEDKQFFEEFKRDNPEVVVQNYCKRTMVAGSKGLFDSTGFRIQP